MENQPLYIVNIFVAGGNQRGASSFSGWMDILYYHNEFNFDDFRLSLKDIALSFIEGGTSCAKDLYFFMTILKITNRDKIPIFKRVKVKLTTALKQ